MASGKLPEDIKQECIWIVRGYERRRRAYMEARRDAMEIGGGPSYTTYTKLIRKGTKEETEERRAFMPHTAGGVSRDVEAREERLEAIEAAPDTQRMKAVEYALGRVGEGLPGPGREKLRQAVMLNCVSGRKHPYERLGLDIVSREDFYRKHRARFLCDIAKFLGLF